MSIRIPESDLAFSAAWLGPEGGLSETLLRVARELHLDRVMVGPHFAPEAPDHLGKRLRKGKVAPVAVRHPFFMGGKSLEEEAWDLLADPRPAAGDRAIDLIRRTAGAARDLGVRKVVLTAGRILDPELENAYTEALELFEAEGLTDPVRNLLASAHDRMRGFLEAHVDRILRRLHRLLKQEPEMVFCLQNRLPFHAFPQFTTLEWIFEDLNSPRLGYWHHTGNAHLHERLGIVEEGAWLGRYGPRLIGVTLHDAVGIEQGLPPGMGEVDFKGLKEALPSEALRVLALRSGASIEEARLGLSELRARGF